MIDNGWVLGLFSNLMQNSLVAVLTPLTGPGSEMHSFRILLSSLCCGPDTITADHKSKFAIDPRLLPLVGFIDLNRLLNPMVAKFLVPIMA